MSNEVNGKSNLLLFRPTKAAGNNCQSLLRIFPSFAAKEIRCVRNDARNQANLVEAI